MESVTSFLKPDVQLPCVGFDPRFALTECRNGVLGLLSLSRLEEFLKNAGMYRLVPATAGQHNDSGMCTDRVFYFIHSRLGRDHDPLLLFSVLNNTVVGGSFYGEIAHVFHI